MAYTATTGSAFRQKAGTLSQKLGTEFAAIQTETNSLDTSVSTINTSLGAGIKLVKGTLAAVAANGFTFAWQNPEASKILVFKFFMRVTTGGGTATAVIDVGAAANATTHADNLIDGLDINQTGIFDNVTDKGSAGKPIVLLDENGGTTDYITGQILTEKADTLAGKYYIVYTVV
jgi:hypothetical protein